MSNRFVICKADMICSWKFNLNKNMDCAVCYNSLSSNSVSDLQQGKDSRIVIAKCGHAYHRSCIDPWIKQNPRCPLCASSWLESTPVDYTLSIPPVQNSPKINKLELEGDILLDNMNSKKQN